MQQTVANPHTAATKFIQIHGFLTPLMMKKKPVIYTHLFFLQAIYKGPHFHSIYNDRREKTSAFKSASPSQGFQPTSDAAGTEGMDVFFLGGKNGPSVESREDGPKIGSFCLGPRTL